MTADAAADVKGDRGDRDAVRVIGAALGTDALQTMSVTDVVPMI